nr:AraC family transcriptional regulator [Pseudoflavonifractor phocaeensis]
MIIHYCGNEACAPGYKFGPAVREHYLLHYVTSGKGLVFLDGQSFHVTAGQCFLIQPNQMASYLADRTDPWVYFWVGFSGTSCENILDSIRQSSSIPVFNTTHPERSLLYMKQILECKNLKSGQEFAISGSFLLFLSTIEGKAQLSKGTELNDITTLATNYISHNYPYDISVDDVARAACVSRTTLYRAFKESFHMSVQQYLMDVRLSTAAEMLSTTDYSINEIVLSCGFGNYQYFIRLFQSKKKMSPTQYRKHYRIKNYEYDSCPCDM